MYRRLPIICLLILVSCSLLAPRGALASRSAASAGDRQYAQHLVPIFSSMVTAANDVQVGANAVSSQRYSTATTKFAQALSLYRSTRSRLNALHPTSGMNRTARFLTSALNDYVRAVTIYHTSAQGKDTQSMMKGLPYYTRGNKETNQAVAAMQAALK